MTENYRALVAILVLALPALYFVRRPLAFAAIAGADYRLRAGVWLALTSALFVSPGFWIFVGVAALVLAFASQADSEPLGLYFFVMLVAPPFESIIPGFAGINQFIAIDYLRVLSLVLLLPLAIRSAGDPGAPRLFKLPSDKYVVAYLALLLAIQFPLSSFTHELRSAISFFIDVWLPYYVCSRRLVEQGRMRGVLASFVAACAVMAVIAVFETLKGWLLYASLPRFLDVYWGFGNYMMREGSLRATVSTGHSIVFGYVMAVAVGLNIALRPLYPTTRSWTLVTALLTGGIIVSFSRGPWVGAATVLLVALAIGPGAAGRLALAGIVGAAGVATLMLLGMGTKILALLPFVGTADASTITYRQQLFEVSWSVLMQNPIFGSPYYMSDPAMQQMRQGEGIIDMVNSYLGVAMVSGFAGLTLFLGAFLPNLFRLWLSVKDASDRTSGFEATGRALTATLAGVLVIIATSSSVNAIPVIYWCLAGMCAAHLYVWKARTAAAWRSATDSGLRPLRA